MAATPTWNPPWEEAASHEEATEWIDDRRAENGLQRRGGLDQFHIEPWSTVMRIAPPPNVWVGFNAACPG